MPHLVLNKKHIHLDKQTGTFILVYLESELHYLTKELFGDGTCSIVRNVKHGNIFCVNLDNVDNDGVPQTKTWEETLHGHSNFYTKVYFDKFQTELEIPT